MGASRLPHVVELIIILHLLSLVLWFLGRSVAALPETERPDGISPALVPPPPPTTTFGNRALHETIHHTLTYGHKAGCLAS